MQTVEITAKSVAEATAAAAEKLGVAPEQVTITVLEEAKGLFGRSTVRVRAEAGSPDVEAEPAKPAKAPKAAKKVAEPVAEPSTPAVVESVATPEPVAAEPEAPKKSRGGRGKSKPEAPVQTEAVAEVTKEAVEEIVASAADAEQIVEMIREILESAKLNVNVKVGEVSGRYVSVVLDGKDAAFLVGKHGEVLNAMQYLVNIMAGRKFNNGVRATLDCNDYRRRREEALTGLATKIASEVKQRHEEAVLDALPAFERRIVHKALSEIEGVTTYSEGEEPNRRVVIAPAE